jgi:hypothetical protein
LRARSDKPAFGACLQPLGKPSQRLLVVQALCGLSERFEVFSAQLSPVKAA